MAGLGRSESNNLPPQLTSFVGREHEIAEVKRLVLSSRLLTLTGAGGCGKTRLALQVAGDIVDEFPGGVWMIDLAPLAEASFVSRAVAGALSVPEQPGRELRDTLADSLRSRALLLLWDNCEHVLSTSADLADTLLRECPSLRILVTSREPLGVEGEIRWTVPSLSFPELHEPRPLTDLIQYEAVRLFVDRAIAAHSTFTLTASNGRAVAHLCRQLDGIPLAIEMAAAWVRVLTVEEILNRLSDRFQLLSGGNRVTVPRHQTLKAAMDWSYELLSEPERLLLARLSVFAGGCTLEAAEAVCSGRDVERPEMLRLLTRLVDKSLVIADTGGGEARYRLLETVRQYGRARLVDAGDADAIQRRHRDWYLNLAERANARLHGREQTAWLGRLETEHDNFRAAMEWSKAETGGTGAWLRLSGALHEFWFIRGHYTEGREWLEGALRAGTTSPAPARALALCGAGILAWRQGDATGGTLLRQSLALFEEINDQRGAAYVLHHLAHVAEEEAEFGQTTNMFERSVVVFKEAADKWGVGWSLYCLGHSMLLRGDHERATAMLTESLALCREVGNRFTTAYALGSLGAVAAGQGAYDRATALIEEGLAIGRQIGSRNYLSWGTCGLAKVLVARGDPVRATVLYRESLALLRELGNKRGIADTLEGLAGAASAQGDHRRAARLFGAVDALLARSRFRFWPDNAGDHDRHVAAARTALGEAPFHAAWTEGGMMSFEEAIEYALAPPAAPQSKSEGPAKPATERRAGLLAPREQEVAVLIADGKTNREIAARLSITEGTVEAHVQHILNKLGFNTRAQIAGWVVAHQLRSASPREE